MHMATDMHMEMQPRERIAAHVKMASLLAASQRFAHARRHYDAALQLLRASPTPSDASNNDNNRNHSSNTTTTVPHVQYALAGVLVRLQERDAAIAMYEQVLQHAPTYAEAHANLAAQLMISGHLTRAREHCEQAITLAPRAREAHYNLNVILRRLGEQRAAIARYWGYLERDSGHALHAPDWAQYFANEDGDSKTRRVPEPAHAPIACHPEDPGAVLVTVTVVCVKWGTKYGAEYVNRLYHSLMRHVDHTRAEIGAFVCLTDDATGLDTESSARFQWLPLVPGWSGWWNKISLFSMEIATSLPSRGCCVYIDLDTVIVGDVSEFLVAACLTLQPMATTHLDAVHEPARLAILRTDGMANEMRTCGFNSSLMAWCNDGGLQWLYDTLHDHFEIISAYIYKLDHWLEMNLPSVIFLDDLTPGQIVEYKSLDPMLLEPPPCSRIVCFPLQPKPHQATAPWIAKYWR